jgi:hydroxymethylglutaryl-CoA lyase
MDLPKSVRMVEVGPRDGLQNEPETLPPSVRADLIDRLAACGLNAIEAGSFVSPARVPQMAGTADVLALIDPRPGVSYSVLVPNMTGLNAAIAAGAREIAVFAAASETFSQHNINCSIEHSLARFAPVCAAAAENGVRVRGYISCALGCPYEGAVDAGRVADLAGRLLALGCYEISLGDTIGVGTPAAAAALIDSVAGQVPRDRLAAHFHDTYGQALANLLAVLERGVAVIDSAVAGLGGCPFAPGAAGNAASEDVLYMLNGLGIETGVDLDALAATGRFIAERLGRAPASRASLALSASRAGGITQPGTGDATGS